MLMHIISEYLMVTRGIGAVICTLLATFAFYGMSLIAQPTLPESSIGKVIPELHSRCDFHVVSRNQNSTYLNIISAAHFSSDTTATTIFSVSLDVLVEHHIQDTTRSCTLQSVELKSFVKITDSPFGRE